MTSVLTKGKMFKEDCALYDGQNTTGTRRSSTGGYQTLTHFDWVGIDVYAVHSAKTGAAIQSAITAVGSGNASLFLCPGSWTLSDNLTIPANIVLVMAQGAQIDGAYTLTINGHFRGLDEPFGGSITVSWGSAATGVYTVNDKLTIKGTVDIDGVTMEASSGFDFNGNMDLSGTLSIGSGATRTVGPMGTFVNHTDGYTAITTSLVFFDVEDGLVTETWESIGPTGSGADNIWSALDYVPSDADWIEVRAIVDGSNSTGGSGIDALNLYSRKYGSSVDPGWATIIARLTSTNYSGTAAATSLAHAKIPVNSRIFDAYWESDFTTNQILLILTGWGFNP